MHSKQCYKQWLQVNNPPWLTNQSLRLVSLIVNSYRIAFDNSLITYPGVIHSNRQQAKILFTMPNPVMAHDASTDPCLNYANAAALRLWGRCWDEMIGMPSRLTTPEEERAKRQNALLDVNREHAITNYQGIRINSKGEYFSIKNARIWTIWDENNLIYGQAASFNNWCRI